jgi:peroxiredoxin/tetratricopeptide (TPR) repeat protein
MRKMVWIGLIAVLAIAVGVGVGVAWYVRTPHTAEAQFAAAEKLEKDLRAEAAVRSAKDLAPKIDATIEQYQRVWTRFGKTPKDPAAARPWPQIEAVKRIAVIHEKVEKDLKKALADLEQLAKDYPGTEDTEGFALLEEARLIRLQAKDLKADKKPEAEARFKEALAKLEEFRKKFEKSDDAAGALMEIGRIWQDGIEEPPIHALETFEKVLKDYPHSKYEPEAIFRLAAQYEKIKEYARALQLYQRLLEEYPKCDQAGEATLRRGQLLAEQMDQHDEAAKAFEKFAQENPNDPRAGGAAGDARSEKAAAAAEEGRKYGQSRYGGRVPLDTSDDKPLPSEQMLKAFIAEKLDAETYDLNVTLAPAEHRMTVNGTLKLANRGEPKKELLLMLGAGLEVSNWTVDGAVAQTAHSGETVKVVLPAELAKDAETTLGFTYSGQYADAGMMKDLQPGPGGGNRGARPGTTKPAAGPDSWKGKTAPDIALKTPEGKGVSLAAQRGKVVVVDMWATWCPPCRESLPHLQKVSADGALAGRGLVVWGVNEGETTADVEEFMKKNGYTFTVVMDENGDAGKSYTVTGIPMTFIVGRDGTVKEAFLGYGGEATAKAMDEAIEKALAEAAPAIAVAPPKPATLPAPAPTTTMAAATATAPAVPVEKLTMNPQMALGEYGYGLAGAAWYPITIIGDVFDAHVTITTPANVEAVSNGAAVSRVKATEAGKEGRFEFQTHNPVFGLYFAYGPYVVQDKQVGDIHFYTYFRPEHAAKHEGYVEVTNRILSFYAGKYAPFPFEKMAVIEAPLPPFLGGVGPASLMFLQESMVDHPEVPETLLAHELAHQWFGNLIPINLTDPGYNQWLSEGFATYSDALYTEFKDGPKAFGLHIEKYQQLYFQLSMTAKPTAIRDTRGPMQPLYRPVVYEKGALVLHMLRKVMGDEKFFELMRRYVEEYRNKLTNADDFRKLASTVKGSDLSWFFAEWYDRAVYAHWTVDAAVTPDGAGGASTKVTVMQPDDLVTMPADVTLVGAQGDRVVVKDVMLDKKENVVEAKSPFVPVKVVVDEENWVLKRPGADNMWPKAAKP